jgi:bifunctional DNA-binding transcriptional regulator/antitoxin component of YhaV-PrlF toxin-antitoxin module
MKKVVKLRKQGHSWIITIPVELVEDLKWKEGDQVLLETETEVPSYFRGPKILRVGKVE